MATKLSFLYRLKTVGIFFVLYLLISTLTSYSQTNSPELSLTPQEINWIAENPVIKSANILTYVPFSFSPGGKPIGFSVDYLNLVAKKVGLEVEYAEALSWPEAMVLIRDQNIDVFHSISRTGDREEFLHFTAPYFTVPVANYGRVGTQKINSPEDLNGKVIGSVTGSVYANYYRENFPDVKLVEYSMLPVALDALRNGEIDVLTSSTFTIQYFIAQNFITDLEDLGGGFLLDEQGTDSHHLAARQGVPILRDILDKGIAAVSDEELNEIANNWQTNPSNTDTRIDIGLNDEEKKWIDDHPVVTINNRLKRPPFDFSENGAAAGFGVDYMNLIAEKADFEVEYVSGATWAELLSRFEQGEIDILHSIVRNESRDKFIRFSSSYLSVPIVNYGRKGAQPIKSVDDLDGRVIGVINGAALEDVYRTKHPDLELVEFETIADALIGLSSSKIDVFTNSLAAINYSVLQNNIPNLEIIGNDYVLETDMFDHRIGTQLDNEILMNIIEKGKAFISSAEYQQISRKWLTLELGQSLINLNDDEREWLKQNPVISVSTDPALAPLEFVDEHDEISGIAGDFLSLIADKLHVKFKWSGNQGFTEGVEATLAGETHIISAIAPTPLRAQQFYLSDNYLSAVHMIFARNDSSIYSTINGLEGRTVAQVKGYTINDRVNDAYPAIEAVEVDTIDEALRMLSTGEVDAFIADILTTSYYLSRGGFANIVVVGQTEFSGDTSIGTSRNYPLLASAINKAMASISTVERNAISRKWQSLSVESGTDLTLVRNISLAAALIVLLILIWNYSLRKEINQRQNAETKLIKAQQSAETANAAKSSFLANMSHEIRTPLNAIIGFSDAMILGVGGKVNSPKHQEYLTDIKNSGEHLAVVIKDILDLSKIEAGKWQLIERDFDLDDCIEHSIKMHRKAASEKNVDITYTGIKNLTVVGDPFAIKRVIINLISNSIKFVNIGGIIQLNTLISPDGNLKISIIDNGIGIPEDRLDHVLNPFEQHGHNHELNDEGTGLGLSIVQKMVELHGGTFKLSSGVNVGTEATITLPADRIYHREDIPIRQNNS